MKTIALLSAGLLLAFGQVAKAESSDTLLTEAQRAYLSGHVDEAKQKFQTVLALDPKNPTAQNYLRMIVAQEKNSEGAGPEKQLKALVLEKVELSDASLGAALKYLKLKAAQQSGDKIQVNFAIQLPAEFVMNQKVTLNLANIPFTEALHYLCDQVGIEYKIEKYAIVVKMKSPAAAR